MATFEERLQVIEQDLVRLEQDNAKLKQDHAELKQKVELQTVILRELAGNARLDRITLLFNSLVQEK